MSYRDPSRAELGTSGPACPVTRSCDRLGEGGMGVVYKVRAGGTQPPGRPEDDSRRKPGEARIFDRFSTEAEAVARLRHAHIIQIYDIGEANGSAVRCLELLEGGSLEDRLAGTPQPGEPRPSCWKRWRGRCQLAHHAGIIHRDLKPRTSLHRRRRAQDHRLRPGQAARIGRHQTETGQIMGSPSYMAPEQARGQTPRTSARRPTSTRWGPSSTRCSPAGRPSRGRPRSRRSAR